MLMSQQPAAFVLLCLGYERTDGDSNIIISWPGLLFPVLSTCIPAYTHFARWLHQFNSEFLIIHLKCFYFPRIQSASFRAVVPNRHWFMGHLVLGRIERINNFFYFHFIDTQKDVVFWKTESLLESSICSSWCAWHVPVSVTWYPKLSPKTS